MLVVDKAMGMRVERSEALFMISQMDLLARVPGNPHGIQTQRLGPLSVITAAAVPNLELVNRILGAGPEDLEALREAAAFMRQRGIRPRVDICPLNDGAAFLKRLHEDGWRAQSFQVALFGEPKSTVPPLPPGVEIRVITSDEEAKSAGEAYAAGFMTGGGTQLSAMSTMLADIIPVVWNQPGWLAYLALADGCPAGAALLYIAEGIGCLAGASTLPESRGRGVQKALLHRRIADAAAAGCDLVTSQTGNGTVSQNNMEKIGVRIAYTKMAFMMDH